MRDSRDFLFYDVQGDGKVATAQPINRTLASVIVALDVAWVIGSIVLIFGNLLPLTTGGKWGILPTVELRWRAWRTLDVVFGFRNTRYDDIALDLHSFGCRTHIVQRGSTTVVSIDPSANGRSSPARRSRRS